METSLGVEDEFFGDQSSESDANSTTNESITRIQNETPSDPYGNVADHEYRSRAATVKTLSYLDGYDETKEDQLQDGFADGYRKSFGDAFRIGSKLGLTCGKLALKESLTLGLQSELSGSGNFRNNKKEVSGAAGLIRYFLTREIVAGGSVGNVEEIYEEALLKLERDLECEEREENLKVG